jgi:arginine deiminase
MFSSYRNHIIEIPDSHHGFLLPKEEDGHKITLEGGDIMVVSENHLLIGVSERTTAEAAAKITHKVFEKGLMEKVSVIRIPKKRDYMHIDTIFTQVKRDVWVMLGNFSRNAAKFKDADTIEKAMELKKEEKIRITQFHKKSPGHPVSFETLEDLLTDISRNDLGCRAGVRFIYSGNNEFPYNAREQWTDSCNLLALKEGVVLAYDRNDKTTEAFREGGFSVIHIKDLLPRLESGETDISTITDTVILMPSAELSRARGGFHCMSLPLCRDDIS